MSEEILYIDDGELVYYINENEFITCDEIPYPMLEGIKHLQQKVEQLEKENKKLKEENKRIFQNVNDDELLISNAMNYAELKKAEKRLEQLENIRKEAIKYVKSKEFQENFSYVMNECQVRSAILKILDKKGSEE